MDLKKISGLFFGLSFLMAIFLFTEIGRDYISTPLATNLFLFFGAIAFVLNLIGYRNGKQDPGFNLFYWIGSILILIGLMFKMMHWPFSEYMLIGGLVLAGLSFFLPKNLLDKQNKDDELLDN